MSVFSFPFFVQFSFTEHTIRDAERNIFRPFFVTSYISRLSALYIIFRGNPLYVNQSYAVAMLFLAAPSTTTASCTRRMIRILGAMRGPAHHPPVKRRTTSLTW